jgi:hypothetical protein
MRSRIHFRNGNRRIFSRPENTVRRRQSNGNHLGSDKETGAGIKKRHPEIDWAAVAAAGNVHRHEYDVVDVKTDLAHRSERPCPTAIRSFKRAGTSAASPNARSSRALRVTRQYFRPKAKAKSRAGSDSGEVGILISVIIRLHNAALAHPSSGTIGWNQSDQR